MDLLKFKEMNRTQSIELDRIKKKKKNKAKNTVVSKKTFMNSTSNLKSNVIGTNQDLEGLDNMDKELQVAQNIHSKL